MYAQAVSACFGCGKMFCYNPLRVPSIPHPKTGYREPICRACVDLVNPRRIANGLAPIVPASDAYDACHADELDG